MSLRTLLYGADDGPVPPPDPDETPINVSTSGLLTILFGDRPARQRLWHWYEAHCDTEREPTNEQWEVVGQVPRKLVWRTTEYGDEEYCRMQAAYRNAHPIDGLKWRAKRR